MALLNKPIYTQEDIWGKEGAKTLPPSAKIKAGWHQEMMPAEYENWIQNRQDHAIAYMFQMGIPEWDALTEYIANKSVIQYNGSLYIAQTTNTGTSPTANPAAWATLLDRNVRFVAKTSDTGAAVLPTGSTAQRPVTGVLGHYRMNTTLGKIEFWDGGAWSQVLDSRVLTGASSVSGLWSFSGAVTGGTGLRFGATNHILRNFTATGASEVVNASGVKFGQRPDGTFYATLPDGTEQHFYSDAKPLPLVSAFALQVLGGGTNQTIDQKVASVFELPLIVPETTLTIPMFVQTPAVARQLTILIQQDSVGARKVKWPTNIKWASAKEPVLSFLPNREDVVTLLSTDGGITWRGFVAGGFFFS